MATCEDYVRSVERFECVECLDRFRMVYPDMWRLQVHQLAFGHGAWRVVSDDADSVEWDNS